jgi:hypothetical protein
MPKYYVTTYDAEKEAFTPQKGVRKGPYTLWGLRTALRALRELGYDATKEDNSVLVERHPPPLVERGIMTTTCRCKECSAYSDSPLFMEQG